MIDSELVRRGEDLPDQVLHELKKTTKGCSPIRYVLNEAAGRYIILCRNDYQIIQTGALTLNGEEGEMQARTVDCVEYGISCTQGTFGNRHSLSFWTTSLDDIPEQAAGVIIDRSEFHDALKLLDGLVEDHLIGEAVLKFEDKKDVIGKQKGCVWEGTI